MPLDLFIRAWQRAGSIGSSNRLAFAHLMTGQIAQALIGGVFIRLAESGIVKDLFDKLVDGQVVVENHHSDVNQLGSALADDAHSQQPFVSAREDELQHSRGVSDDMATG